MITLSIFLKEFVDLLRDRRVRRLSGHGTNL